MASYTVIWPVGSLIQQKFIGKQEVSYSQALRFSLYGGFFVAPTLFCWLKFASSIWPKSDLRSAIVKARYKKNLLFFFSVSLACNNYFNLFSLFNEQALVEQVSYGPAAMCCFFFGINLMEFKPVEECINEVKQKFWPTYKAMRISFNRFYTVLINRVYLTNVFHILFFQTAICVWPILQTINFTLIPERNRVVYVSVCSLMWTSFLAYMKSLETKEKKIAEESQSVEKSPQETTKTAVLSH